MAQRQLVDWDAIEKACIAGMTEKEASEQFEVSYDALRKRSHRFKWPTPQRVKRRARQLSKSSEPALDAIASTWIEKSEKHREMAFKLGHESLAKMKARAPKNFREAEIADKIARRAAGLDSADVVQQTLIQINESTADQPVEVSQVSG